MLEKFKSLISNDHIFFGLLVVLVGIGSFALGKVSVQTLVIPEVSITANGQSGSVSGLYLEDVVKEEEISATASEMILVASKSGTKYHLVSCPGSKQIKEANKIFFSSKEAAEAAGYKPAANCPGLQ